jgi:hypothetical protein
MRSIPVAAMAALCLALPVGAQASSPCLDLDLATPSAVEACVRTEPKITGRFPTWLRPEHTCHEGQRVIMRLQLQARAAAEKRRLTGAELRDADLPRVSCGVLAEVVESLHGRKPAWLACTGYDGSEAHMRNCIAGMAKGRAYRARFQPQALARLDCDDLRKRYEFALGRVYDFHAGDDGAARRLPPGYAPLPCPVFEAMAADAGARARRAQQVAREAAQDRTEARARALAEREQVEREQRTAEMAQARERTRAAQDALAAREQDLLLQRRAQPQSEDRVEADAVYAALVELLHDIYPAKTTVTPIGQARLIPTSTGLHAESGPTTVTRTLAPLQDFSCSEPNRFAMSRCEGRLRVLERIETPPATAALQLLTGQTPMPLAFADRSKDIAFDVQYADDRWRLVGDERVRVFLEGYATPPGEFWSAYLPHTAWPHGRPRKNDGKARSAYIDAASGPAMSLFFSLGCPHCLDDLNPKWLDMLEIIARNDVADIELVEVSGLIAARGRDDDADLAAGAEALNAAWVYDCAVSTAAATPLDALRRFVDTLQAFDFEREQWRDWVYDPRAAEAVRAYARNIEITEAYRECLSDDGRKAALAGINARRARAQRELDDPTPVYLFDGRQVTRSELSARLLALMEAKTTAP